MSAITVSPFNWAASDEGVENSRKTTSNHAQVIDLNAERMRRRSRDDAEAEELRLAMLRHPAVRGGQSFRQPSESLPSGPVKALWSMARRALLYLSALLLVVALGATAGFLMREEPYSGPTWDHSVGAGESLWSLATGIETPRPVEQVIEDIRQLNSLESTGLQVGQVLTLPAH